MAITRKGKVLTPRQQKAYVQKLSGWTTAEYNKEYDKLRNRVRNYERITGLPKGSINVADMLAQSVSRTYYGDPQTKLFTAVSAVTSAGTGTALSQSAIKKGKKAAEAYIAARYAGALEKSELTRATYAQFLKTSPDATIAEREEVILAAIKGAKSLTVAAKVYRNEMGREGIIVPFEPDTL